VIFKACKLLLLFICIPRIRRINVAAQTIEPILQWLSFISALHVHERRGVSRSVCILRAKLINTAYWLYTSL